MSLKEDVDGYRVPVVEVSASEGLEGQHLLSALPQRQPSLMFLIAQLRPVENGVMSYEDRR